MTELDATTLAAVVGGEYGDAVAKDPQWQRELLACWATTQSIPDQAARTKAQAACVNTYYDQFWPNRRWD